MKIKNEEIQLKIVKKQDCQFLYKLLKERGPVASISHKKMPTYSQHVKFVMSKPYSVWYIVYHKKEKVGSFYISKQNEIGLFIKTEFQKMGLSKKIMQLIIKKHPKKRFLANVNPKNKNSIKFLKNNGFNLIQQTYELNMKN